MKTFKFFFTLMLWLSMGVASFAFTGSNFQPGEGYYLFNIYQSKFLSLDNKLDNTNPVRFVATDKGFTINDVDYTATKNTQGFYQLKRLNKFFAFEDKVVNQDAPNDENQAKYVGGGVTCKETGYNTDRSYWQLISDEEYAEWQGKKKFTVASLNVDGMPKSLSLNLLVYKKDFDLNPDAKEGPGATAIGNRLLTSGFDVVGVSEDFNFHSELWNAAWNDGAGYNATTHDKELSQDNANLFNYMSSKPLFTTDGLCLFYKMGSVDQATLEGTEKRTAWNDHYGYTDNGADGLITKGFRFYVVKLEDGTEVDLYILHMDAETSPEDIEARDSQLTQLANAIIASDNKRPIIIIGDTNCRYTRDKVKEHFIDAIDADPRFTCLDPWIQFGRNGIYPTFGSADIVASTNGYRRGEVVDKIFYINNTMSNIRLEAETYAQDLSFVNEEGEPLCDHKPCVVTFSYHEYDSEAEGNYSGKTVYLRNRGTGRYLANGGWWGAHAVVSNYPKDMHIDTLPNGKHDIFSKYGHITDNAYIDSTNPDEYIKEFDLIDVDGYKVLSYTWNGEKRALTADDPTFFNDNPLYRYVTTAPLNADDEMQQWEIITQKMFDDMIAEATPDNPVNVSHLISAANFDRIEWDEHGMWKKEDVGSSVTMKGVGGADDAYCNYNYSIEKSASTGWFARDQRWKLLQTITDLPNGYYTASCQGFVMGEGSVNFYAGNDNGWYGGDIVNYTSESEDDRPLPKDQASAAAAFNKNLYNNIISTPILVTDGTIEIGVEHSIDKLETWTCVDNFQLFYIGTNVDEGEDGNDEPDAITAPTLHNNAPTYNLAGQRVTTGYKGIIIKNGKKIQVK